MKICVFFGHRTTHTDLTERIADAAREAIKTYGITTFWCGGYGQFDFQASKAIRKLQLEFPEIQLERVLAYLDQPLSPFALYDSTIYPEGLEQVPRRFAISRRNRWMVSRCDLLICGIDHDFGGAYQAYLMAQRAGKTVWNIGMLQE